MSKNIKVQRDGVTETFSGVKKIKTEHPSEGTVNWIPMDETELAIKTVNQNGTYKASSDGYYGYRQFTVNTKNKGKTVGTKKDGRTYAVETDEDGWLNETLLPDNIRINPQPTKTTYQNGESISLSGAVVKAYSQNYIWEGSGYSGGVIPHGELTLDPTTASGGGGNPEATSDLDVSPFPSSIPYTMGTNISIYQKESLSTNVVLSKSAKITGGSAGAGTKRSIGIASSETTFTFSVNQGTAINAASYTYNNKTVYYMYYQGFYYENEGGKCIPNFVNYSGQVSSSAIANIAWTMIHGTISGGGTTDKVTVKWNRPEDNEELTTSFNITVS